MDKSKDLFTFFLSVFQFRVVKKKKQGNYTPLYKKNPTRSKRSSKSKTIKRQKKE